VHRALFPESRNIFSEFQAPIDKHFVLDSRKRYGGAFQNKTDLSWILQIYGSSPKFVLEVGTFVGTSAVELGRILQQREGVLLCIDPFTGSGEMWFLPVLRSRCSFNAGQPRIFELWMNKIIKSNLTSTVLPWRVTSLVAADFLHYLPWKIDFVFLDSAHSVGETFVEIAAYWSVLPVGSFIFGDDYNSFPGVKHDVDMFSNTTNSELLLSPSGRIWALQKTTSTLSI